MRHDRKEGLVFPSNNFLYGWNDLGDGHRNGFYVVFRLKFIQRMREVVDPNSYVKSIKLAYPTFMLIVRRPRNKGKFAWSRNWFWLAVDG